MTTVPDERLAVDHVVIGVPDLDDAAARLLSAYGLLALPGGRHPGWGTANRIVPLGDSYLELVAVVDPAVAAGTPFGRWVADMAARRCAGGWAVRTDDMAATAARLGLDVVPGSRVRADGMELRWELAGVPGDDPATRSLPFFIAWGSGTPHPGSAPVHHPAGDDLRLDRLEVECDPDDLERWLGAHTLPLEVRGGSDGVTGVDLRAPLASLTVRLPL